MFKKNYEVRAKELRTGQDFAAGFWRRFYTRRGAESWCSRMNTVNDSTGFGLHIYYVHDLRLSA